MRSESQYHAGELYYELYVRETEIGNRPVIRTWRCLGLQPSCRGPALEFELLARSDEEVQKLFFIDDHVLGVMLRFDQMRVALSCWYETTSADIDVEEPTRTNEVDRISLEIGPLEGDSCAIAVETDLPAHDPKTRTIALRVIIKPWSTIDDCERAFERHRVPRHVSDLSIWQSSFEELPVPVLEWLCGLSGVESLYLSYCRFGRPDVESILSWQKSLKRVSFTSCNIDDSTVETLRHLSELRNVSVLDARSEFPSFERLSVLSNLKGLSFYRCPVDDAALDRLLCFTNLEQLSLTNCPVTDLGGRKLSELKNLTHVSLAETSIGDATLRSLTECRNLQQIYVAGTQVTEEGIRSFLSAVPRCRIVLTRQLCEAPKRE